MTVVRIINQILQETGYDIAGLSDVTGIGIGPLYKMARGETNKISFLSASKINSAIPEYSIEFLRGLNKKSETSHKKEDSSIEDLFAEALIERVKPLLIGSQENHKRNIEQSDKILELVQHLLLDNDELRDRLAIMESQMNKITELHS